MPAIDIPVAGTVVLLRDGALGPEVLLIERPDRGSFAGAWVFPGGKVEEVDAERAAPGGELDVAREAGARETLEEVGLSLDSAAMVALARWVPPPETPVRIRTWFFLARAPAGHLRLAVSEAIASRWISPAVALDAHAHGQIKLYPPTWMTLHSLVPFDDVESALGAASSSGPATFETQVLASSGGMTLVWAGDAEHGPNPDPQGSARHRLDVGSLPWVHTRHE